MVFSHFFGTPQSLHLQTFLIWYEPTGILQHPTSLWSILVFSFLKAVFGSHQDQIYKEDSHSLPGTVHPELSVSVLHQKELQPI